MKQRRFVLALAFIAACGAAAPALADAAKPAADTAYGDWVLHCGKARNGAEACALHQKIMSQDTKLPVAAFAISRGSDGAALRLAAILPLGLDIPAGVSGKVASAPIPFPITTCVRRGCIASATIDAPLLAALQGADSFTTTFKMRPVAAPTTIPVSLKGLDAGLKALAAK